MTPPAGVRLALGLYRAALRRIAAPGLAPAHHDMELAFADVCRHAHAARGATGVCLMTLAELWDVLKTRAGGARHISVPGPGQPPPRGSRGWLTDTWHALRALRARPAETAMSIALLTLGLATTGAIFAVADALLLHPAPFPQADRLVQIWSKTPQASINSVPRDLAARWADRTDLFESGGAVTQGSALVTSQGDPESIPAAFVSPGLFETLRVKPALGRTFAEGEGRAGTDHVVILSDAIWAARFGRDPGAIGASMDINGASYTVVGVMPPDFWFPYTAQKLWFPSDLRQPVPARANVSVTPYLRMRDGLTRADVTAAVQAAGPEMAKLASRPWKLGATTHYVDDVLLDPGARRSIWILFGATVLLMLVVCANVANLGLSQAFSRSRDAAVRSALGASRWRLVRQSLVEQLLIGAAALALALPVTAGALRLAATLLPSTYRLNNLNAIDVDVRLLVVMTAIAMLAPLIAGLVPAIAGTRLSLAGTLKAGGRSLRGSRGARRFRQGMVVVEIACSVVLLVSAALLVKSFVRLQQSDKGFDSANLLSVTVGFPAASFGSGVSRDLYLDAALARLGQLPGVTAATAASGVPPDNGGITFGTMQIEGRSDEQPRLVASMYEVQPSFVPTLGLRVLEGRNFTPEDGSDQVLIDRALAEKYWKDSSAVGQRFKVADGKWHQVLGVVAPVRDDSGGSFPQLFIPLERHSADGPVEVASDAMADWKHIALRVDDPAAVTPLVRNALREVNSAVVIKDVDRVEDLLAKDLDQPRFLLALMLVFAGAGLVLAAAGVYSVLSCLVAEQLRDYGIRLMLGARPSEITRAILASSLATTVIGLIVGGVGAAALGTTITTVLFEVRPRDPLSYGVVAAVLLLAAIVASWRPARRAMRVDPMTLLREE
jgi:predicted permease